MAPTTVSQSRQDRTRGGPRDQTSPIQVVLDVCLFLILFVTPWLISTQLKEVFNTTKNIWVGLVVTAATVAWLADGFMRRELRIPKGKVVTFYSLLIMWCLLTISWSSCWRLSIVEFGYQLAMFLLFLVTYCNVFDHERIENLLHFSIAAGVVTAGYGLIQYYGFDEPIFKRLTSMFPDAFMPWFDFRFLILPPKPDEPTKIYSTMGHRNYLAGYLIAVIPITLSRLYAAVSNVIADRQPLEGAIKKIREKGFDFDAALTAFGILRGPLVYVISLVLMFWVVLLTQTRGSWIGLALGLSFFFLMLNMRFRIYAGWRRSAGILALLFFWIWLIGPKYHFGVTNPFQKDPKSITTRVGETADLGNNASAHQRLLIYRTALYIIFDDWSNFLVGKGFGTFGIHYMPYQKIVLRPEPPKNFEKWKSQLLEYYAKSLPDANVPRSSIQKFIDRLFEDLLFHGRRGTEHWNVEINKSIYAHNELLHFWTEIGLVGVSLMFFLLFFFFKDSVVYLFTTPPKDESLLFLGMVSAVMAVLGHNLFTFDLHLAYTSALFWFLIAAAQRYTDRDDWVVSWARRVEEPVRTQGQAFDLGLEETPEGAVSAYASLTEATEETETGAAEWRVALRGPDGKEVERKLGKHGFVAVRRPPSPGEWRAKLLGPGGVAHEISMDFEPSNPYGRPIAYASIVILAFLVSRSIWSQAVLENHWRDAFLKFRNHQFEESFIDYKCAQKQDPNRGEVLFDYGRALMDSNRNVPAIKTFVKATESFVDPANYHNIALCYYKENDLVNAEKAYRTALDLNVIYEQSLSNLAYLLMDKASKATSEKKPKEAAEWNKEAEELLMRGLRFYRNNPQFSSTLGAMRAQQSQFKDVPELDEKGKPAVDLNGKPIIKLGAISLFKKALEADKGQCKVWINYATVLYNEKMYAEAVQAMRDGKKNCKGQEGEELFSSKFVNILKGYYHEALAKHPTDKTIITSYGRDLIDAGQYTEAQEVFRKLLESISPGDPTASFYLAQCFFKQGYRDQARTELTRLKSALPPGNPLAKEVDAQLDEINQESSQSRMPDSTGPSIPLGNLGLPLPTPSPH